MVYTKNNKTALVQSKVDPVVKEHVKEILNALGLSTSQAINMFLKQIIIQNGLPFEVKVPETLSQEEVREISRSYKVIKEGKFTEVKNKSELKKHLSKLKKEL